MENSWEVLRKAIDSKGIKQISSDLKLSSSLLYKWCQPPVTEEDEFSSGTINPLDRIKILYEKTDSPEIIQWVCECGGGFFIKNPKTSKRDNILQDMQKIIREFSDVLDVTSESVKDKRITDEEAKKIRREWEHLKGLGESMVASCETKNYHLL
ncbi:MAG: hypothetical protein A2231_04300 [Candidatus Firestonebacteria bacterium RIFOXYA2_FULL_40_8]|nr:MAG: hypothetical protein A2231_04300 [Candidatus Firestonebacteria bacterium RIFOXYA2_FULL_40_8]